MLSIWLSEWVFDSSWEIQFRRISIADSSFRQEMYLSAFFSEPITEWWWFLSNQNEEFAWKFMFYKETSSSKTSWLNLKNLHMVCLWGFPHIGVDRASKLGTKLKRCWVLGAKVREMLEWEGKAEDVGRENLDFSGPWGGIYWPLAGAPLSDRLNRSLPTSWLHHRSAEGKKVKRRLRDSARQTQLGLLPWVYESFTYGKEAKLPAAFNTLLRIIFNQRLSCLFLSYVRASLVAQQ